jgi:hypothetical protein
MTNISKQSKVKQSTTIKAQARKIVHSLDMRPRRRREDTHFVRGGRATLSLSGIGHAY